VIKEEREALKRFLTWMRGFEESVLYEDYQKHEGFTDEEYGKTLAILWKSVENDKEYFAITRLHRDDIKSQGFKEEFTDEEMEYIAGKMADDYLNQLYWGSLRIIVENVIEQRGKQ